MLKPLYLLLVCVFLRFGVLALTSDDEDVDCGDSESCKSSVNEGSKEYHSTNYKDIQAAWFAASTIPNRDPRFIRVDPFGNIILGREFSKHSHFGWIALVNLETKKFTAVQKEYYGRDNDDNHENALKYNSKDSSQDAFLDLLEIGLRGHLQDEQSEPICWTPSEVHQSLMRFDVAALDWHKRLFSKHKNYGMHGHNTIFQPMEVHLKQHSLTEQMLRLSDPLKTLIRVQNFRRQCSAIMDIFDAPEDTEKVKEEVKNNWGLPRVASFLKRKPQVPVNSAPRVSKPKIAAVAASAPAPVRQVAPKPLNFDKDFPALK